MTTALPPIASTQPSVSRRCPAAKRKQKTSSASGTVTALSPKSVMKFRPGTRSGGGGANYRFGYHRGELRDLRGAVARALDGGEIGRKMRLVEHRAQHHCDTIRGERLRQHHRIGVAAAGKPPGDTSAAGKWAVADEAATTGRQQLGIALGDAVRELVEQRVAPHAIHRPDRVDIARDAIGANFPGSDLGVEKILELAGQIPR